MNTKALIKPEVIIRKNRSLHHPQNNRTRRHPHRTAGGCPYLDEDYTIFGEVVDGMRVVESINKIPVDASEHPLKEVTIKRIRIKK